MSDDLEELFGAPVPISQTVKPAPPTTISPPMPTVPVAPPLQAYGQRMAQAFDDKLKTKPDYKKLFEELKGYAVKLNEDPSLPILNQQLAEIQRMRDRVHQMFIDAVINFRKYERVWETIQNAELPTRTEKSAEQRIAAVRDTFKDFYGAYKEGEDYRAIVESTYKNLIGGNDNISRQVTILQELARVEGLSPRYDRPTRTSTPSSPGGGIDWSNIPSSRNP